MEERGSSRRVRMFAIGAILGCAISGLIVAMELFVEFSPGSIILLALFGFLSTLFGKRDRDKKPSSFAGDLFGFLLGVVLVALLAHWKLGAWYGFIVFALEIPLASGIWLREEIDSKRQVQGDKSGTAR